MTPETQINALLNIAKAAPISPPSDSLVSRVLADAATAMPPAPRPHPRVKPHLLWRLLAPIGGPGGALALTTCAALGVVVGASYTDTAQTIPGLDTVLAAFGDNIDTTTPFETLSLLMSES